MYGTAQMHHIQKDILRKLAYDSPLRFSQLQPKHLPTNVFSYHIKRLKETGYVDMVADGYVATRKAKKALTHLESSANVSAHPLILTMLCVRDSRGRYLLINRGSEPFRGWYGMPSGMMHKNETIAEAAARELVEKTGIVADPGDLMDCGVLDFQYVQKGTDDTFAHCIAFVFSYTADTDSEAEFLSGAVNKYGILSWSDLGGGNILPEVQRVVDMIESGSSISSVKFEEPI